MASFTLLDSPRVLVFLLVQLLITVTNMILMKRLPLRRVTRPGSSNLLQTSATRVSVLIPARDEEDSIEACVRSLLEQDHANMEVIVLDDGSRDRTRAKLDSIASERLRIMTGRPLPDCWLGKSWACAQLAEEATGDVLLFTDADTVHAPNTVSSALAALEEGGVDLLTAIVRSRAVTLGEQLTVPFPVWSVLTLLPLAIANILPRSAAFSAGNGKFLMIRRRVYQEIGGHGALRDHAVEDLALTRLVKKQGYRWRLFDAVGLVTSRMYHGFAEARDGFTKNYFAIFDYRLLLALFVWVWLNAITWWPLVTIGLALGRDRPESGLLLSVMAILVAALLWMLASWKSGLPGHLFLLYPVIIGVSTYIGFRSIWLTLTGGTTWKGRTLRGPRPTLL